MSLYWFAQAAIIRYHRLGGLNNRNLFHHTSGDWKFKIKVSASLISSEASLFGVQMVAFLLCPHMVFLLSDTFLVSILVSKFPLLIRTSVIGLGPTCIISFYLIYLFKGPVSKFSHILRYWELGFNI